jgi:hypothetical protein
MCRSRTVSDMGGSALDELLCATSSCAISCMAAADDQKLRGVGGGGIAAIVRHMAMRENQL